MLSCGDDFHKEVLHRAKLALIACRSPKVIAENSNKNIQVYTGNLPGNKTMPQRSKMMASSKGLEPSTFGVFRRRKPTRYHCANRPNLEGKFLT
jgi:hypothetical protein